MASQSGEEALQHYPNYLHDRFVTPRLPEGEDPAAHTPAAAVAAIAAHGGRCVKMYYEEGAWLPGGATWQHPSRDILSEVARAAEAHGMMLFLHGISPAAHRLALDAGVPAMAHGLWDWGNAVGDPAMPDDVAATIADAARVHMRLQPTMRTLGQSMSMFQPDLLDDPAWRDAVPEAYLAYLRTDAQRQIDYFIEDFAEDFELAEVPAIQASFLARYGRSLARFDAMGGVLLFGTDTAVGSLGWGNPPGLNGYWEMRAWSESGIAPATILDAATRRNAEAIGLGAEIGTVEIGKRADLVLLRLNPLETVEAYDAVDLVVLEGRPIARSELSARR